MLQIMENQVISKINKIQNLNDIEYVKGEMYSIFSILILSKKQFSKNTEIKEFLDKFNINFKEYVYVSRTMVLSRTLRKIERADEELIKNMRSVLFNIISPRRENSKGNSKKYKKNSEYLLEVIDRYTRNDKK